MTSKPTLPSKTLPRKILRSNLQKDEDKAEEEGDGASDLLLPCEKLERLGWADDEREAR